MMESSGERATGTPNTVYDLSSILFHALEGGASYDQYVQDAEETGDEELADFFRRVRDEDAMRADEAQILLAERTPAAGAEGVAPSEGLATGIPLTTGSGAPGTDPIEDVPPLRAEPIGAAPGTEPIEDVPPRPIEDVPPPREEPVGAAPRRTEPGAIAPGMEEEIPPPGEEPLVGTGEVPPPRASGREEDALPRTEEAPPPPRTEERPLGTEGTMPPVTEEASPTRPEGVPPRTEEVSPRAEEQERAGQTERDRGEDRGLVDRVRDALLSDDDEERRRREETDEPRRR